MDNGKVYLVGAGPGDPELLTLKAVRLLESADVVLYDRLIGDEILDHTKKSATIVYVGKEHPKPLVTQEETNDLLVKYAQEGHQVVRIKGGDPFVFGRGGEEAIHLEKHGIEWEVVPGLSSCIVAAQSAGIPVTHRGVAGNFGVLTGHECLGKKHYTQWNCFEGLDTLVILMGVQHRQEIAQKLIKAGRSPMEPVAYIENATRSNQRVTRTRLGEVAKNPPAVKSPAVTVVGHVVNCLKQATDPLAYPPLKAILDEEARSHIQ